MDEIKLLLDAEMLIHKKLSEKNGYYDCEARVVSEKRIWAMQEMLKDKEK